MRDCHLVEAFDQDGAMPSALLQRDDGLWLYYVGWRVTTDVPFETAIGLAISRDDGATFERMSSAPIFGPGVDGSLSVSSPHVIEDDGVLVMLHSRVESWTSVNGRLEPRYGLWIAISEDGVSWRSEPLPAIPLADVREGGITRPTIMRYGGLWHMWFSKRGVAGYRSNKNDAYRIAYAWSRDGRTWHRADALNQFGNPPGAGDWDDVMQAYPFVVQVDDAVYCLYSGNGFGQAGVGYATLESGVSGLPRAAAMVETT